MNSRPTLTQHSEAFVADLLNHTLNFIIAKGYFVRGYDAEDLAGMMTVEGLIALRGRPFIGPIYWCAVRRRLASAIENTNRKRRLLPTVPLQDWMVFSDDGGMSRLTDHIALEQIVKAANLSERQRAVLHEYRLGDDTAREVGERLGLPEKAVVNAEYKALKKLRVAAKGEGVAE